jgi:hypothetical protein
MFTPIHSQSNTMDLTFKPKKPIHRKATPNSAKSILRPNRARPIANYKKWPFHFPPNTSPNNLNCSCSHIKLKHALALKSPFNVNRLHVLHFCISPKVETEQSILPCLSNSICGNTKYRRRHIKSYNLWPLLPFE